MIQASSNKPSILIVEDNHLDILVLKVLLEKYFNLYIVTNGSDALALRVGGPLASCGAASNIL
jgi:CheY-like chemotaxis protein